MISSALSLTKPCKLSRQLHPHQLPCSSKRRYVAFRQPQQSTTSMPMRSVASSLDALPGTAPHPGLLLERYRHPEDYNSICEVCKSNWGPDYLERLLPEYAKRDDVLLLVAKDEEGGNLLGIVGGDIRGDVVVLFGLRVAKDARGRGVGHFLMTGIYTKVQDHFEQLGHKVHNIVSVTFNPNEPAQRVIRRLLHGPWVKADFWPAPSFLSAYEKTFGWPGQQAASDNRILDSIPGARQVLTGDEHAVQLLSHWQVATSCKQVSEALVAIRKRHLHQQKERFAQAGHSNDWVDGYVSQMPLEWLPSFFELHPASGAWAQEQLDKQQVWVLYAPGSAQPKPLGVVVLSNSPEGNRWAAGIVADDHSVVHSALLLLDAQQPHWVAFIDRGCLYNSPLQGEQLKEAAQLHPADPPVYKTTEGAVDMIVYSKATH